MKTCKIVHINDGNPAEVTNGNRLYVENFPHAEKILDVYLNAGWEVKHIIPSVDPAMPEQDGFSFFNTGFIVYLEKEV